MDGWTEVVTTLVVVLPPGCLWLGWLWGRKSAYERASAEALAEREADELERIEIEDRGRRQVRTVVQGEFGPSPYSAATHDLPLTVRDASRKNGADL